MGKADENLHAIPADDPAPPPYSEALQRPSRQAGAEGAEASAVCATSAYRPFPRVTNAYYQWAITKTFHLGESADQPLYAVATHISYFGNKAQGLVLHNGPTSSAPMLAAAGEEPGWTAYSSSPNSVITLPPLPGSPPGRCTEIMRAIVSCKTVCFRFSVEVAHGGGLRREDFVWQTCKGKEAKGLVDGPWECGFKLTRLGGGRAGGEGSTSKAPAGLGGEEEILAMFVWNRSWSLMHPFKLQYEDSGTRDVMGERWDLMVVMTGLRLWFLKHQNRISRDFAVSEDKDMLPGSKG